MPPNATFPPELPTIPQDFGQAASPIVVDDFLASIDVGRVLAGRYRLIELVGAGGMSRVYKALDQRIAPQDAAFVEGGLAAAAPETAAPVVIAVKIMAKAFTAAGRFAALTAHVRRLQRLAHPAIVKLFGCERDGSIAFVTMEYLEGESTYAMLHRRALGSPVPLEAHTAKRIIACVADALAYAHGQGAVHGDLKPGNVMVTSEFTCRLIDFGMTRWLVRPGASGPDSPTPESAFLPEVTPQYASPQLLAGEEPRPSDDVFSLACVAYELLTGVHPFDGESGSRGVKALPPQRPGLTPSEYSALLRALQIERDKRTPSVRQFMADFAPPQRRSSNKRWLLYAALAAVAIVGSYLWGERTEKSVPQPQVAKTITPGVLPDAASPPLVASTVAVTATVGAVIRDCPTCPPMTVMPAGEFQQGAADSERDALPLEKPRHAVYISHLLAMSTTDATLDEFRHFAEATGRDMQGCDTYDGDWRHRAAASWQQPGFAQTPRHPVVCVSWNDAVAYARWISAATGHRYRLPTASEWEYAARAGSTDARPWKSDPAGACAVANVADHAAERRYPGWQVFPCSDGYVYTAPVGSFQTNEFGLSDMLGNVLVWTQDCWQADYVGAPRDGSAREMLGCAEHELRGGSWFSPPAIVKASYRSHYAADYRTSSVGLRLVRELD